MPEDCNTLDVRGGGGRGDEAVTDDDGAAKLDLVYRHGASGVVFLSGDIIVDVDEMEGPDGEWIA